jgi:hypothetical protein
MPRINFTSKYGITAVPEMFKISHPFPYPSYNTLTFEEWYLRNWDALRDAMEREYLPVIWTGYLVRNSFGEDANAIQVLQSFIDMLPRSKKYYTIVQFDLGCMVDFKDLDIVVCAMSGNRIDYPLPLLTMPHRHRYTTQRDKFATFVGKNTHPVRGEMLRLFDKQWRYDQPPEKIYITENRHDLLAYTKVLSESIFGLCPRGFGQTSFRLAECVESGAIPVYISDEFIIPHNVEFDYGILVKASEVKDLKDILLSVSLQQRNEMQSKLPSVYKDLFSYEGSKKRMIEYLKNT